MRKWIWILFLQSFVAQADVVLTNPNFAAEASSFEQLVTSAKTGTEVRFQDVRNFKSGVCYSKNDQSVAVKTVLVSLNQEIQGEEVTKMAFYFMQHGDQDIEAGSSEARQLQAYLEDDWRFWSTVNEEGGLHFFYDIENNGNLDGKIRVVEVDGKLVMTYKNLIGQKLTFMGKTFRSTKNEIIGACLF